MWNNQKEMQNDLRQMWNNPKGTQSDQGDTETESK